MTAVEGNGRPTQILVSVLYGLSTFSIVILNKSLLYSYNFKFPIIILILRVIFTILVLNILSLMRVIKLQPYSLARVKASAVMSLIYGTDSVLGLMALRHMNMAVFAVIQQCVPLVTMFMSMVVLTNKQFPSNLTVMAVVLITSGCILAGFGDAGFDLTAYICGTSCVLLQSVYLLLVQKYTLEKFSIADILQLNSYNTLPFLLLCSILNTEMSHALQFEYTQHIDLIFILCSAVSVGLLFNFSALLCTKTTSALTTGVIAGLRTIGQTVIGSFIFGGISTNLETYIGINANLIGGILYIISKYQERPTADSNIHNKKDNVVSTTN